MATWPCRCYWSGSNGGWSSATSRTLTSCCGDTVDDDNSPGGCDAYARSGFDSSRRWYTGSDTRCNSARRNIGSGSPSPVTLNSM